MAFKLSKKAESDLVSIWDYTFTIWSVAQADRYIQLIFDEIEYICKYPNSGRNYSHVRNGYFRTKVKSHFIFYRLNENDGRIEVIRILHQRMDINERLME